MEPGNKQRLLAEHLPDAVAYHQIVTDDKGNPVDYIFIDMNPAFEEMFNLPKDRTIDRKISEVYPDINESSVDWIGTFGKVALHGGYSRFEHYYEPLNRWYEITACSDEHGFFAVYFRDITTGKQTEEALKYLQKSLESSTDAIGMSTPQGHHYYQNKTFTNLFGNVGEYPPDTMYVDKKIGEEVFRTIISGKEWTGEVKMYAKDRQVLDILLRAYANRDDTGKITGLVGIHTDITDYNQAEQALQQNERKFRAAFEGSHDAITVMTIDGKLIDCNQRSLEIYGLSNKEEFMAARPADLSPPVQPDGRNSRHASRQYIKEAITKGEPVRFEWLHQHKDGNTFPAEIILTSYKTGEDIALQATIRDITGRKQAEEKLLASEAKYHGIFDAVMDALMVFNNDDVIVEANPAACRIYGYDREEFIGLAGQDIVHPDYQYLLVKFMEDVQQNGYFHTESVDVRQDGSAFHVEVSGSPIIFQGEEHLLAIVRDISARKQMEKLLRDSEERFRYIAEFSPLPLAIVDDQGNYEFLNPKFTEVFGYTITDVPTRMKWSELAYPNPLYRQKVIEIWEKDRAETDNDVAMTRSFTITCKDGLAKEILIKAVLMDNGKHLFTYEDITERKQAEQKLANYTLELEQLYHQLDLELDKARQVHERTLPTALPAVEGVSFAAHYQPAKKVGGDFYDVLLSGNKLIFYLSDVPGHGLDGAMLSVFIKQTVSSYISFNPPESISPARVLGYLAKRFRKENYPDELYFCIFMAVLDMDTLELSYCGAGFQEELLLRMGSGEKLKLTAKGLFITSYLPTEMLKLYDNHVVITPGTTLFCNTDGLTEEGNRGLYYRKRLQDVFFENAHFSPQLVAHAVVEDFHNFTEGSLQGKDDISFLVLQLDLQEMETYHFQLASNFGELKRLREDALNLLTGIEDVNEFAACLYELAANAIEHGNRFDLEKVVSVEVTVMDSYLQAVVQDQGKGFNWRERVDKPIELEGNQERGRGIAMTRICAERLFYNKQGNQATLLVTRKEGS